MRNQPGNPLSPTIALSTSSPRQATAIYIATRTSTPPPPRAHPADNTRLANDHIAPGVHGVPRLQRHLLSRPRPQLTVHVGGMLQKETLLSLDPLRSVTRLRTHLFFGTQNDDLVLSKGRQ